MKTFKKVLSVVLALTMVLGTMTFTGVSAADGDTIYEDFGADVVIDAESNTVTTASGISITATEELYSKGMKVDDNGFFIPAGTNDEVFEEVVFGFDPITEGTAEISFDLTVLSAGHSHPGKLGRLEGLDADGNNANVIGHFIHSCNTYAGVAYDPVVYFGQGQPTDTVVAQLNEKIRVTYAIDMTEKTYEVLVNNNSVQTGKIAETVAEANCIKFSDDWNHGTEYIDNVTVAYGIEANQKTITFEGADVEPITATYGRLVTLPVPTLDGMAFNGWVNEDGEEVANSIIVTEDMNLTADLRGKVAISEKFDNFTLDVENTSVSTNSGLTVTAGGAFYALNPTADGVLYAKAYTNGNGVTGDMSMTFNFPEIRKGKVKLAFDLAIPMTGFSNWMSVYGKPYFTVGNSETGNNAAALYTRGMNGTGTRDSEVYLATANGGNGSSDNTIGTITESSDLANIEYIIDLDAKTYSVTWGGQTYSDIAFASDATSIDNFTIAFAEDGIRNKNCDIKIDNLTVIEDPDNSNYTVTFMNGDEIYEEQTVAVFGDAEMPETAPSQRGEAFTGWVDSEGNAVTEDMLLNVTADATYYATFRGLISAKETFDTGFSIDYENKTMTSNSGLTFSSTKETSFDTENGLKVGDNGLRVDLNSGALADSDVMIKFPNIASGKVYIAFDLINNHTSNGHTQDRLALGIGDSATSTWATTLTTVDKDQFKTEDGTVVPEGTIEYVIDLDNGTYTITAGGELVGGTHVLNATDKFDAIYVTTNDKEWYSVPFAFDNLTLIENPDTNYKTVTFMNGDAVYSTQTVAVFENAVMPDEEPTINGKLFLGWVDAEGNAVTEDMLKNVTADATYYATYRDLLNIKEAFDDVTIDYANGNISNNSGFNLSAAADAYGYSDQFTIENGALKLIGMVYNNTAYDTNFYMDFPAITRGTVEVSFDINPISWGNSGNHNSSFFGIGNSSMVSGETVEDNSIVSLENGYSGKGIAHKNTLLKSQFTGEWVTVKVVITMPEGETAGSYDVYIGGEKMVEGATFNNNLSSIDRIIFSQNTVSEAKFRNSNNYIDNVTVIENPENNTKTVTFMNGSEVYNTQTVAVFGNAVMPETAPSVAGKVFLGWKTADGKEVTADMLANITADATYYATFRDTVNIVEDFETGFTLIPAVLEKDAEGAYTGNVTTAGSITTDSGFTFSSETANAYGALSVAAANGSNALYNNGYIGTNSKLSDIYMDFPAISSGKVYISFDIRIPHLGQGGANNAFNNKMFLAIGNAEEGNAVELIRTYNEEIVTVDGVDTAKKTTKVTTENGTAVAYQPTSEYYTYEYVIDLDNGTYSLEISATNGDALTLTDVALGKDITYIDRIALPQQADINTWYNTPWYLDNVTLVENYNGTVEPPVEPTTYTVTFYDEDGTTKLYETTVEEGATAVYAGAAPSKAATAQYTYTFAGWDKALTNITADTTVKATYTSVVNKYKVTFVDFDGTTLKEEDVEYGGNATAPADPTRDGYTFKGWEGTYTNVVATVVITAIYEENAAEMEPVTFLNTTIEPATSADVEAILGEALPDGTYAWFVKHSITDLALDRTGGALSGGYSGTLLDYYQINLEFASKEEFDNTFLLGVTVTEMSAVKAENGGGGENNGVYGYRTPWASQGEVTAAYPNKNMAIDGIENVLVTLLVTKTDTFTLNVNGEYGTMKFVNSDYDPADRIYYDSTPEKVNMNIQNNGWESYLVGFNPEKLTVVDGVVGGGSEEVAPLAYANGKIVVNSTENGMLYIVKKDGEGVVTSQKAYSVVANTEAKYDFAEDETAYLWSTVLDPICNPFTIAE